VGPPRENKKEKPKKLERNTFYAYSDDGDQNVRKDDLQRSNELHGEYVGEKGGKKKSSRGGGGGCRVNIAGGIHALQKDLRLGQGIRKSTEEKKESSCGRNGLKEKDGEEGGTSGTEGKEWLTNVSGGSREGTEISDKNQR